VNDRTLKALEYEKIIAQLETFAATATGKDMIRELRPSDDIGWIRESLAITTEAVYYLREVERAPLGGIFDIRSSVRRAQLNGILSPTELMEIGSTLRASRLMKDFLTKLSANRNEIQILPEWGSRLGSFPVMEREIERCIGPEGEILDSASAKLHSLRSQGKIIQNRIRDKLDSMIHSSDNAKYLQDLIVTVRNERYVIPVRQ
jgi:DNA mismatch repair protein MutS2